MLISANVKQHELIYLNVSLGMLLYFVFKNSDTELYERQPVFYM